MYMIQKAFFTAALGALAFTAFGDDANFPLPSDDLGIVGGVTVAAGSAIASSTVLIVGQESDSTFICSGSIIAENFVITAAHCLGTTGRANLTIAFRTNIRGRGITMKAAAQTRPSDYGARTEADSVDNDDIALIKLPSALPEGYAPAQLLSDSSAIRDGAAVILAGYGINVAVAPSEATKDNAGAGVLRKVGQTIVDARYGSTEVLINEHKKGACHGDSGGPAFIQVGGQPMLFGVASRLTIHDRIANTGSISDFSCSVDMVYSNILDHQSWIQNTMSKL